MKEEQDLYVCVYLIGIGGWTGVSWVCGYVTFNMHLKHQIRYLEMIV